MHVFFEYLVAGEKAALSRFFISSPKSIKESLERKAKYRLQRRMPKEKVAGITSLYISTYLFLVSSCLADSPPRNKKIH
jgi:hypothetical protein